MGQCFPAVRFGDGHLKIQGRRCAQADGGDGGTAVLVRDGDCISAGQELVERNLVAAGVPSVKIGADAAIGVGARLPIGIRGAAESVWRGR